MWGIAAGASPPAAFLWSPLDISHARLIRFQCRCIRPAAIPQKARSEVHFAMSFIFTLVLAWLLPLLLPAWGSLFASPILPTG